MTQTIDLSTARLADCGSLAWRQVMERLTALTRAYAWTGRTGKSDDGPALAFGPAARAAVDEAVSEALAAMLDLPEDTLMGEAMGYGVGTARRAIRCVESGRTAGGSRAPLRESGDMPAQVQGADDLWTDAEREDQVREVWADMSDCASTHRATLALLAEGERDASASDEAWWKRCQRATRELRAIRKERERLTPTPRPADYEAAARRRRATAKAARRVENARRIDAARAAAASLA